MQLRIFIGKPRFILFLLILIITLASIYYSISLREALEQMNAKPVSIEGTITAVDCSKDGAYIYLGMRDDRIIALDHQDQTVWEFQTGGQVLDLKVNGNCIYASADDRRLYIIDQSGLLVKDIKVGYRPKTISGSINGERVITGTSMSAMKNRLQLYDVKGNRIFSKDPEDIIVDVFMLPDSKRAICVARGAVIYIVNQDGEVLAQNKIEYYPVDVAYSPELKLVVVCDEGNHVYAFDESLKLKWKASFDEKLNAVDINYLSQQIIVAANDGQLIVMDAVKGHEDTRLVSEREIRLLRVNKATGELYVLKGNNGLRRYEARVLSGFARTQSTVKVLNIANVILIILTALSLLALFPKAGGKIWKALSGLLKKVYRHRISYLLLLPTFALLLVFNYYPAVSGLFIAFTDYKPGVYMKWVGLKNFSAMVQNPYFWTGVGNMLAFLVTDLLKALIPPILFAELIIAMRSKRTQYWTRVALYLPGILPGIAALMIWTNGILGMNGLINELLTLVGLGDWVTPWLGDERTALWSLIFIGFPWVGAYIIFYGALIGLPDSLFDAAKIDGCGWWKRIVSIDVPLITPQIKFVFVTTFIASIQDFGRVYVTTMGGPGHATYIPMLELFYNMSKFQNYGEAAAMGLFLFVVIFGATLMNLRMRTTSDS